MQDMRIIVGSTLTNRVVVAHMEETEGRWDASISGELVRFGLSCGCCSPLQHSHMCDHRSFPRNTCAEDCRSESDLHSFKLPPPKKSRSRCFSTPQPVDRSESNFPSSRFLDVLDLHLRPLPRPLQLRRMVWSKGFLLARTRRSPSNQIW